MAEDQERVHVGSGERVTVTRADPATRPSAAVRHAHVRGEYDPGDEVEPELPEGRTRDRVRWGPIVAGLLTALTSLLLLSLLGLAIGLTVVNAGTAAAQGGPPAETGPASAIWAAISGLLSFLLGGYVAGRTASLFSRGWGAFNGAMVFLLAVPLILWLASQGLGGILGNLGAFAGDLGNQARQAAGDAQPIDVARAAERARNTAWGALTGSLLGLGASALGGWLGTPRRLLGARGGAEIDRGRGRYTT